MMALIWGESKIPGSFERRCHAMPNSGPSLFDPEIEQDLPCLVIGGRYRRGDAAKRKQMAKQGRGRVNEGRSY